MIRLTLLFCLGLGAPASAQSRAPRFANYPAKHVMHTQMVQLPLPKEDENDDCKLRRHDSIDKTNRANFTGRYFLVVWSCSMACVSAATGRIIDVPFSISGWRRTHDKFEAVEFRHDSRLVVFNGARNEEENDMGRHYYVLENSALQFLKTEKNRSGNSCGRRGSAWPYFEPWRAQ